MKNFFNELKAYEPIPRRLIEQDDLSMQARFLYCIMAVKPEGWVYYESALKKQMHIDDSRTFRKYRDELMSAGWLVKSGQAMTEDGRFSACVYTLKATPANADVHFLHTDVQKTPYGKISRTAKNAQLNNNTLYKHNTHSIDIHTHTQLTAQEVKEEDVVEQPSPAKIVWDTWLAEKCPDAFMRLAPLNNRQAEALNKFDRHNVCQLFMEINAKAIEYVGRSLYDVFITFMNCQFKRNYTSKRR